MGIERKKIHIDRIEDGVVVAYDTDGNEYTMCSRIADLKENDIVTAAVNELGEVIEVDVNSEETTAKKEALQSRLNRLFNS